MSSTPDSSARRLAPYSQQRPSPRDTLPLSIDLCPLPDLPDAGADPDAEATQRAIAQRRALEGSARINFMSFTRSGASLKEAAALAGCSLRTIYGWIADDPRFRQQYHYARWEAESESLDPVRQLATESVQAAVYLAERQRKRSLRRPTSRVEQPLQEILARIESRLQTMLSGFAAAVHSIEDQELRKRLDSELSSQVEPVAALFHELWQRFEAT